MSERESRTAGRGPVRRAVIRWLLVAAAAAMAAQLVPWPPAARLLPSLSPLLGLAGAAAARRAGLVALPGLAVVALALWRGRWFCVHACPTGTLAEAASRLRPGARGRYVAIPRVGRWLAVLLVGSAAAGYPLALWLDPLSAFSGFFSVWRTPLTAAGLSMATGLAVILLLSLLCPQVWCQRLCPLGAAQDLLGLAGKAARRPRGEPGDAPPATEGIGRRAFVGLAAGLAAGAAVGRVLRRRPPVPIRPPGAAPESRFTGLCARCGNCVRACPQGIIVPDLGTTGLAGALTPVLDMSRGYCNEWCRACTLACPTGAIRPLTMEAKRDLSIGTAVVARGRCLAWKDHLYCMVCQEFCPYGAIRSVEQGGVNCPLVDPTLCRGCGACQNDCPARPEKAIIVRGTPQRQAAAIPAYSHGEE